MRCFYIQLDSLCGHVHCVHFRIPSLTTPSLVPRLFCVGGEGSGIHSLRMRQIRSIRVRLRHLAVKLGLGGAQL